MFGTRNSIRIVVALAGVTALAVGGLALASSPSAPTQPAPVPGGVVDTDQIRSGLLKAPLAFVANTGNLDERVAFSLNGSSASVYLTDAGLTYRLSSPRPATKEANPALPIEGPAPATPAWVVRQDFRDAAAVRPVAAEASPTIVSYFKGGPERWHTSVPTAASVRYADLWPGIDATYAGTGERLKYTFTVAPGADPTAIALAYRGAEAVTLTHQGELAVATPAGGFTDAAPTAYQDIDGRRVPVEVSYALEAPEADGSQPYRFAVGPYDTSRPLVVDPATIVYAGFLGGSGDDRGYGIAVDAAGAAYITGWTISTAATFPETVGPDLTANGASDAFVAKVAPDGASLVYAGFIGGSGSDLGFGIAVDATGAAYVTGWTLSTEATFPVVGGPDLTANGSGDAFVAKVAITKASPTISTQASPGGLLGAPVRDVATLAGGSSPTGTVTFRLFSDAACTTEVFSSTNPVTAGTTATSDWFTPAAAGTYYWTAVYGGDAANNAATSPCGAPNESVTIGAFEGPAPTQTITGDFLGPLTVGAGQSVLITGARVVGPVTVNPGGSLTVVDSRISRGITADAPAFFSLCGTQVSGPSPGIALSVTNAAVPVRIGDPAAGCAGNRFAGQVNVSNNLAVTFGANIVSHNATLDDNGLGTTVIKANNVFGTLGCSGNDPAPTNAGQPNTAGSKTGQCSVL